MTFRHFFVLLAFLAAVFFFALASFEVDLAHILLVPVGLLCLAIGFVAAFVVEHTP